MAVPEDAASLLETFVQDVANLPAEIAHLLEEVQAKDKIIQECRNTITARDNSIQKFIKVNGSLVQNPKEDAYSRTIIQNYDRAQILQEEKVGLAEKAAVLLDRHIKRMDIKIRDLQTDGSMPADSTLPSLLHPSPANRVPPVGSGPSTGVSTPLNPLSINAGGSSTSIANSGLARLTAPAPSNARTAHMLAAGAAPNGPATPNMAGTPLLNARSNRESSAESTNKRRRLNPQLGSVPATSSNLARHSSLGPGTPKAGTPSSARGSSAGPRKKPTTNKKLAPHQVATAARKAKAQKSASVKKHASGTPNTTAASATRKLLSTIFKTPNPGADGAVDGSDDDSALSSVSGATSPTSSAGASDEENENPASPSRATVPPHASHPGVPRVRNDDDEEMEDAEEGEGDEASDDRKYCTCRSVSYGNMVACDNDDCPYEWFHWSCVGVTKEPVGKWYCAECRSRM